MFCPKCGSNNEDGARFCFSCGTRMTDGSTQAPQSGPAWRDFPQQMPTPPPTPVPFTPPPPPVVYQQPVIPPPQVIIGAPRASSSMGPLFVLLSVIGLFGAVGFAVVRLVDINTDDWPLIGKEAKKQEKGPGEGILVSINGPCRDAAGQPCNVILDIIDFKITPANTQVTYEAKATGQAGCQVTVPPDKDAVARQEAAGKPGPYLEGARGRYYPLLAGEGFLATGGTLTCDKAQKGSWAFQPITGETTVKLRYPNIPAARIDVQPLAGKVLPPDDPISVIPLQSTGCTTAQNQPCRAGWEIGPYGIGIDGSPTVFFSVRFDGPPNTPNCTVAWQPLVGVHQREVAAGRKGIHLQLIGGAPGDLTMTGTGGMASANAPHPCNQVLSGFLRFAPGNLTQTVNLMFWEFPPVQIPLKAQ
jgi:hypothetical protein